MRLLKITVIGFLNFKRIDDMKKAFLSFSVILCIFIMGCNDAQLTDLQIREMQSKELKGSFDDAYKANLQVLQDYGYVIKSTDKESGVIQGETAFRKHKKYFWNGLLINNEATATLEQFGDNTVKERLCLVRKEKKRSTNALSMTTIFVEDATTIVDKDLYQKMYDEIQKEMFIRQNLNK